MYDLPKVNTANTMKNDITLASDIKIKLISNDFFNMDILWSISPFLNQEHLSIASVDIGIDRLIKFESYISISDIIQNYEIPRSLRQWITSDSVKMTLRSILTEKELQFLELHFEMFYQIETFLATNTIFVRI